MIVSSTVQIITAIALAVILFVIAFSVYNLESVRALQAAGKIKKQTVIFKGVKDLAVNKDEAYNTIDPTNPTYKDMSNSINQKSGAEYTYNFWMYISKSAFDTQGAFNTSGWQPTTEHTDTGLLRRNVDGKVYKNTTTEDHKPFVLLLRGSKKAFAYRSLCSTSTNNDLKVDVMVKNPMVKFERGADVLSVEINTMQTPDAVKEQSRDTCDEQSKDWEYMNSYRVALKGLRNQDHLHDKWFMVSVVVQDTYPNDPLPIRNKVRVRIYINGVMELDKYLDGRLADTSGSASIIKNNPGNLYVAPTIKMGETVLSKELSSSSHVGNIRMADLSYYNYALDVKELEGVYAAGINKVIAQGTTASSSSVDSSYMDNMSVPSERNVLSELNRST